MPTNTSISRLGDFLERLGTGKPAPGSGLRVGADGRLRRRSRGDGREALRRLLGRLARHRGPGAGAPGPGGAARARRRAGLGRCARGAEAARARTRRRRTASSRRSSTSPSPFRFRSRRRPPTRRRSQRWPPSSARARFGPTPPRPPCWPRPVRERPPISWPSISRCRTATSASPGRGRASRSQQTRRCALSTSAR